MILTNKEHTQSTKFESAGYIAEKLNYTLRYIVDQLKSVDIVPSSLKNRIFLGGLLSTSSSSSLPTALVQEQAIRGMCFIQDGKKCLLSSSSICDRSLISGDKELGIVIADEEKIKYLEQEIWSSHIAHAHAHTDVGGSSSSTATTGITFHSFFEACENQQGNVYKHRQWKDDETISFNKSYDFFLEKLLGRIYYT